ncbi:MAG TPA: Ig-like domain-containing protein [Opitutaceae bacterium]|nr:Ig-like domain-containing protein [Opitutaceae bacterium]
MKLWPKIYIASVLGVTGVFRAAAQQPVVSVDIKYVNVGGTASSLAPIAFTGGTNFPSPNEAFGPYGVPNTVNIAALAVGTNLVSSFTYSFFVNGVSIGVTTGPVLPPNHAVVQWTPPQPGSYFFTVTATDGPNTATSLPVRYFATGTVVNSPVAGTIVPQGSSVVLKADATVGQGFIKSIQFYDNGVAIGSPDVTLPYSLIYTPPGAPGAPHSITAQATDNNNNLLAMSSPIALNVVTAIPSLPTSVISTPVHNSAVAIPTGSTPTPIPVTVDARSSTGVVTKVELYIDGVLFGTKTGYPYTFNWTPTVVDTYDLVALTYDDKNNVVASTTSSTPTSTPAPTSVAVSALPTITMTSPTNGGTVTGGSPIQLSASATESNPAYTITSVQFFVDGVFVGQATAPSSGSTYTVTATLQQKKDSSGAVLSSTITALATNNVGLAGVSAPIVVTVTSGGGGGGGTVIGIPPVVSVTSPTAGANLSVGNPVSITSSASDADGNISGVQFLVNNAVVGAADTTFPYSTSWTPVALGNYSLTARAIDNDGNVVTSSAVVVTVGTNAGPAVTLTSPAATTTVSAGTPINLAAAASDVDGTITGVRFLANGISVGSATSAPYRATWTPTGGGTFLITAEVTDNTGNVTTSLPVTVNVSGNRVPLVSITAPAIGATTQVGTGASPATLTVSASDPDGTIRSVDFYASGVLIGSRTSPPYTVTWTPTAEGIYQLTAVATDNSFASTTSAAVPVLAVATGGSSSVNVFTGIYVGGTESGKFAAVSLGGKMAAFIGRSTQGPVKNYFYPGLALDSSGGFSRSSGTSNLISGSTTGSSISGTLGATGLFSGVNPLLTLSPSATAFPATGYFSGSLSGRPASSLTGIVGADGSIMVAMSDGTFSDVGDTKVDSTGSFFLTTASGNTLSGKVEPSTGFLTGTLTVVGNGAFTAPATGSLTSGGTFSDGVLKGLSTRASVGTGNNILIAGFIVDGTAAKQVIIRGIGPSLAGVNSPLANPMLQLYNGPTQIASNDNWATPIGAGASAGAVATATAQAGLGALSSTSLDSVIVTTLTPGAYTVQLSGVGSTSGNGLLEIYDLDTLAAFTPQKVRAISSRGFVGTAGNELIAGFIVNGNTAKKVLIQAVGPGIATSVSGTLADPVLRIVNMTTNKTVRENDNWETGNDGVVMVDAVNRSGATPLTAGSKDSAILVNLPPGVYTAVVSGAGNSTGIALVQVYEVP